MTTEEIIENSRKETAERIKVLQAFVDRKAIEERRISFDHTEWVENNNPEWRWDKFDYRIKPEFKDGDILFATDWINGYIYINKESNPYITACYCYKVTGGGYLHICNLKNPYDGTLPSIVIKEKEKRFATESEKQQLFDALAKENKRWDAEKKAIVDLPKDTELRSPLSKYYIKLKPKYRPFKNTEECWNEMKKHQPFGWLKPVNKYTNKAKAINISSIGCDDEYPIQFTNDYGDYSFEYLYKEFTFMDETPFGILEEE